jgi:hypothetical protein
VNAALFWTSWIALACFVAAEFGKRPALVSARAPAKWTFPVSACGLVLLLIHMAIGLDIRHDWSHTAAVRDTARQTAAVYGLDWGGGLYVNYVFAGIWALDVWHGTRAGRARPLHRRSGLLWALRVFYFTIIFNGAVVFVAGPRRWLGAGLVLAMVWAWRRR